MPFGRDLPVLAVELHHPVAPRLLDDPEVLLERRPVRLVDGVVLVRRRTVDAVHLLRHRVDPAPLVAAGKAGVRAAAAHVVEHRDVFGDAQRVLRRQYDAELADTDALRVQRDEEVQHHRVVRDLEPFDVEVMLRERDGVIAERIGELRLLLQLGEHPLVQVGPQSGHPLLDLFAGTDGREIEDGSLHSAPIVHRVTSVPKATDGEEALVPSARTVAVRTAVKHGCLIVL